MIVCNQNMMTAHGMKKAGDEYPEATRAHFDRGLVREIKVVEAEEHADRKPTDATKRSIKRNK